MLPVPIKSQGMSDVIAKKMKNLKEVKKMAEGGEVEEDKEYSELEMIFAELLHAIGERDPKLGAQALKDFFVCADAMPHEEYSEEDKKGPGALLTNGSI